MITYRETDSQDLVTIRQLIASEKGDDRALKPEQFVVACINNRIIGCIRTIQAEADCKELASLVVHPKYRLKGIGTNLVNRILQKDKSRPLYLICQQTLVYFYYHQV